MAGSLPAHLGRVLPVDAAVRAAAGIVNALSEAALRGSSRQERMIRQRRWGGARAGGTLPGVGLRPWHRWQLGPQAGSRVLCVPVQGTSQGSTEGRRGWRAAAQRAAGLAAGLPWPWAGGAAGRPSRLHLS